MQKHACLRVNLLAEMPVSERCSCCIAERRLGKKRPGSKSKSAACDDVLQSAKPSPPAGYRTAEHQTFGRAPSFHPSSLKHQAEIAYWRKEWASGNFHTASVELRGYHVHDERDRSRQQPESNVR
jgi:hypothetical protein